MAWVLFYPWGIDHTYLVILLVLSGISYLFILISTWLVATGRASSVFIKYGVILVAIVGIVVLSFLTLGLLQDVLGVHCTDSWGWSTEKCFESVSRWVRFYFFLPTFFIPLTSLITTLLVIGLVTDFIRKNK